VHGNESVDWTTLIPRIVHPTKVVIIEAMLWIRQPLSATQLVQVGDETIDLSSVSYHLRNLADDLKVTECVASRRVRGAIERFYYLIEFDD
jgi:hypothetical protein